MAAETFNAPCLPFTAMFPDVAGYRYSNDCGRRRFFQPTEFDVSIAKHMLKALRASGLQVRPEYDRVIDGGP